ncbi:class IV adenylate cyclase [Patescibacteria group bacterium]|nr:class IV adenylate cyclase [Patescibacteria group bacterium]
MKNKNIEIEIKLPLRNPAEVKKFLNENAKLVSENIYQKDSYYIPAHRDFLAVKYPFEWLRLRKSLKGMFITYKHFFPENAKKTDYCDEFETKIDNLKAMEKMLKSLDFKEVVVVEKSRTTWIFEKVEIVIDEVTDLGFYIELEATGYFKNPQDGKSYLYQILKKLNAKVGEEDLRGYPFRILENKGYKFGE